jgi:hypothetical protein
MLKRSAHRRTSGKIIGWLLFEVALYTVFVVAYYFLVLLLLRAWLKDLFDAHRALYAAMVLPLIIGQTMVLEGVAFGLRLLGRGKPGNPS